MNPWNQLRLFIIGCLIFEVASRMITVLEKERKFNLHYLILIYITTAAMGLAIYYILGIYIRFRDVDYIYSHGSPELLKME